MLFSRFRRLLAQPVANTGSQLRDHQANERTFLSWTRMGLAFAAMSLALSRLSMIDQVFNNAGWHNRPSSQETTAFKEKAPNKVAASLEQIPSHRNKSDIVSDHVDDSFPIYLCQALSIWSFGYGIFRYLSVRRSLIQGRIVPAFYGPIMMTLGSIGVFGLYAQMDSKQRTLPERGRNSS